MPASKRSASDDSGDSARKRARLLFEQQLAEHRASRPRSELVQKSERDSNSSSGSSRHDSGDDDPNRPDPPGPSSEPDPPSADNIASTLLAGRNVFVTGPAGTGKTVLLKQIRHILKTAGKNVATTAPTAAAAIHAEGETLHTWFRLTPNLCKRPLETLAIRATGERISNILKGLDVLIIDEISMVSSEMLTRVNVILQRARERVGHSFGGVRVLVCGDFSQLPPIQPFEYCLTCGNARVVVVEDKTWRCIRCENDVYAADQWAFASPAWRSARFVKILLKRNYRAANPVFRQIIWELFLGNKLSHAHLNAFRQRHLDAVEDSLYILPTRKEVDLHNDHMFGSLPGDAMTYNAFDDQIISPNQLTRTRHQLDRRLPGTGWLAKQSNHALKQTLKLKKDMPVILVHNVHKGKGLVNGLQGKIVDFELRSGNDIISPQNRYGDSGFTLDADDGLRTDHYIPWLLDAGTTNLRYQLQGFIKANQHIEIWPIVHFTNGETETIFPTTVFDEQPYDEDINLFMRTQLPLLPAWALTIHRVQGLTLTNYVTDLSQSFCPALTYVALSRAPGFEHLEARNIDDQGAGYQAVRSFHAQQFPELQSQMRGNGIIAARSARRRRPRP